MPSTQDTWESLPSLLFHFSRSYLHLCVHFYFTIASNHPNTVRISWLKPDSKERGIGCHSCRNPGWLGCTYVASIFFSCGILTGEDLLVYNAEIKKYKGSLYPTVASFSLQTFHYEKVFMWYELLFCKNIRHNGVFWCEKYQALCCWCQKNVC